MQKYQECSDIATQLFKETSDIEVFNILIDSLIKLNKHEEVEKYLKFGLKVAPDQAKISILLKLGYLFIQTEKFGNAKACLVKYLDKVKPSGGLSWQILGKMDINIGNA